MSNIRRKTAEHLTEAWQAPHVTQHDRADLSGFDSFRERFGPRVEKAGGKLTITAVVIKVLATAMDRFPQFASSVDMANEAIVYKQYRHIGVAVDTPNGLLVPVLRDVTYFRIESTGPYWQQVVEAPNLALKVNNRFVRGDATGMNTLTVVDPDGNELNVSIDLYLLSNA